MSIINCPHNRISKSLSRNADFLDCKFWNVVTPNRFEFGKRILLRQFESLARVAFGIDISHVQTGEVAVAAALMNEIERKDGGFENMNTIAQVLAPDSIFPGVGPADIARANAFPRDMYADCRAAVIDALEGADPTNGAVCFCTVDFWNSIGGVSYAKWSMEIEGVKFYGW